MRESYEIESSVYITLHYNVYIIYVIRYIYIFGDVLGRQVLRPLSSLVFCKVSRH